MRKYFSTAALTCMLLAPLAVPAPGGASSTTFRDAASAAERAGRTAWIGSGGLLSGRNSLMEDAMICGCPDAVC